MLYALAYATLSITCCPSRPYLKQNIYFSLLNMIALVGPTTTRGSTVAQLLHFFHGLPCFEGDAAYQRETGGGGANLIKELDI